MNLPDTELKDIRDPGLLDFIGFVTVILNNGMYATRVVSSVPTGSANNGESLLYWDGGSTYRLYFYFNSAWRYITFSG